MKKINLFIISIVALLIFIPSVNAASANVSVSSTNQVVYGNKVTVTVTISSGVGIGSWQMNLNYDKNFLQLTSSTAEGGGNMMAGYATENAGVKSKKYTFTFKSLKTGSTNVSITSALVYAADMSQMSVSAGSKTIKIITQEELEASYSKDNSLKNLSVEGFELTPEFNKDTLEYSVNVPENTESINIIATKNDSTASVSGDGTKEVTSGSNTFEIVVRAQNGAERTYTLKVDVVDKNPIEVKVNNENYTVVKIKEYLPTVSFYTDTTVNIDSFEIPAYINEHTKIVLVGLKNSAGEISLFIYDEATKEYKEYLEIGINKITIYPKKTDKTIKGYQKGTVKINNTEVDCLYYDKKSNFAIIYGTNIETGEETFYMYDKENQTIMKYNDEYSKHLEEQMKLYSYIILGFSGIFVIMFIILIVVCTKKKKNPKKIEQVSKKQKDTNKITEIDKDETKDIPIYENTKKSKKKK